MCVCVYLWEHIPGLKHVGSEASVSVLGQDPTSLKVSIGDVVAEVVADVLVPPEAVPVFPLLYRLVLQTKKTRVTR